MPAPNPLTASDPFGTAVVVPSARAIAKDVQLHVIEFVVETYVNAPDQVGGTEPFINTPVFVGSIFPPVIAPVTTRA
ncbi:MAG: hypothetical protein WA274_00525 [Candidatus Acidiferrales bacterium]